MRHILIIISIFLFSLTIYSCSSSDDGASTTTSTTAIFGTSLFDSSYFGD